MVKATMKSIIVIKMIITNYLSKLSASSSWVHLARPGKIWIRGLQFLKEKNKLSWMRTVVWAYISLNIRDLQSMSWNRCQLKSAEKYKSTSGIKNLSAAIMRLVKVHEANKPDSSRQRSFTLLMTVWSRRRWASHYREKTTNIDNNFEV